MTIQNNTYCSRIQVAFLDTIGDLYGNSGNRFKKINTRGVFNENLFIPYLLGVFPLRMLTREIAYSQTRSSVPVANELMNSLTKK